MIEYIIAYVIIGVVVSFATTIKAGNIETEYFIEKYLGLSENDIKFIVVFAWLPILIFIAMKGKSE